ncbi:hypothetical protein GCM10010446_20040 [Streptomyces enissocaesilis]|uniref:Uncharacterized protein n=1 Tax=Streptomyces enissocaesilis TaxID=332589 RepID=A0ABN3X420_9ACTN
MAFVPAGAVLPVLLPEGFRRRGGMQPAWDFADPVHAGTGTGPHVRTPNLPASVIRLQKSPITVQTKRS